MVRFLWSVLTTVIGAAVGLLLTALILGDEDFEINASGFIWALVIFLLAQAILSPFILKMSVRYASALTGGVALISTFVALLLADIFSDGLSIKTLLGWVLGTVLVWLLSALAGWLVGAVFLKNKLQDRRD
ncbi:phage holin family protein [Demequina sp. NBRC 110053]|uniref:phage holin family protein n=1 Tax=Demequina sp. NBRC 110053 TaxID=1570342 RepID=UPI001356337A|nr:phage holin family protein [Demequina sp. NBRC 110053]